MKLSQAADCFLFRSYFSGFTSYSPPSTSSPSFPGSTSTSGKSKEGKKKKDSTRPVRPEEAPSGLSGPSGPTLKEGLSDSGDDSPFDEKQHKLVPDGNDFKLVFISSDSSKESELNSSLEGATSSSDQDQNKNKSHRHQPNPTPDHEEEHKDSGDYFEDEDMEWSHYATSSNSDFMATSSPKLPPKQKKNGTVGPPLPPVPSSGEDRPPALPPKSKRIHQRQLLQIEDYFQFDNGLAPGTRNSLALSSGAPSVATIRTAATKDRNSPVLNSPRIPKVHNIPILRRNDGPKSGSSSNSNSSSNNSQPASSSEQETLAGGGSSSSGVSMQSVRSNVSSSSNSVARAKKAKGGGDQSETCSQDFEVQAIFNGQKKAAQLKTSSSNTNERETQTSHKSRSKVSDVSLESQERAMDFSTGTSLMTTPRQDPHNNSAEVEEILAGLNRAHDSQNLKERVLLQTGVYLDMARSYNQQHPGGAGKKLPSLSGQTLPDSIKSQGDRSLEEMSIHDQLMFLHDDATDDPKMEEYRSFLLAEIKAMTSANNGSGGGIEVPMSRSLSESDLSELCGASVKAPSPVDLLRAFTPPSGDEREHKRESRGRTASAATGEETAAGAAALANDQGGTRQQFAQPPPPVLPPKRRKHLRADPTQPQQQLQQNNLEGLQHPTKPSGKVWRIYICTCVCTLPLYHIA